MFLYKDFSFIQADNYNRHYWNKNDMASISNTSIHIISVCLIKKKYVPQLGIYLYLSIYTFGANSTLTVFFYTCDMMPNYDTLKKIFWTQSLIELLPHLSGWALVMQKMSLLFEPALAFRKLDFYIVIWCQNIINTQFHIQEHDFPEINPVHRIAWTHSCILFFRWVGASVFST